MPSVAVLLKIIDALKNNKIRFRSATLDKKQVELISPKVKGNPQGCTIDFQYRQDVGTPLTVHAEHDWNDKNNLIEIDGHEKEDADVDIDLDIHFLNAVLEIHLQYEEDGSQHEIVLSAKVKTMSIL